MTDNLDALVEQATDEEQNRTGDAYSVIRRLVQAITELRTEHAALILEHKGTCLERNDWKVEFQKAQARAEALEKTVATLSCGDGAALAEEIARADAAEKERDERQSPHEFLQTMRVASENTKQARAEIERLRGALELATSLFNDTGYLQRKADYARGHLSYHNSIAEQEAPIRKALEGEKS